MQTHLCYLPLSPSLPLLLVLYPLLTPFLPLLPSLSHCPFFNHPPPPSLPLKCRPLQLSKHPREAFAFQLPNSKTSLKHSNYFLKTLSLGVKDAGSSPMRALFFASKSACSYLQHHQKNKPKISNVQRAHTSQEVE